MLKLLIRTDELEQTDKQRWLNLAAFSLVCSIILVALFQLWQLWEKVWLVSDFRAFYYALQDIYAGETPYRYLVQRQPFYYPFWSTLLYLPVSWLPLQSAVRSWLIINILLSVPICWYATKLYLKRLQISWFLLIHTMCLALSTTTLMAGYALALISGFLVLMVKLYEKNYPLLAGLIGAYALTFKPQVTFLLVASYFLWFWLVERAERKKVLRFWLGGIIGGILLIVVSLLIQADWIIKMIDAWRNNSLMGEVRDTYEEIWITSTFPDWFSYLTGSSGIAVQVSYVLFILVLVGMGVYRLINDWRNSPPIWLAVVMAINLTVTPYTRPYDYGLLIIPLIFILAVIYWLLIQNRYRRVICYSLGIVLIFMLPMFSLDYRWFYWQALLLSIMVLSVNSGYLLKSENSKTKKSNQ
jgi:hypothetical protein